MDDVKITTDGHKMVKRARTKACKAIIDMEKLPEDATVEIVAWFAKVARERIGDLDEAVKAYVERY